MNICAIVSTDKDGFHNYIHYLTAFVNYPIVIMFHTVITSIVKRLRSRKYFLVEPALYKDVNGFTGRVSDPRKSNKR